MSKSFSINVVLAVMWLFLAGGGLVGFLTGLIVGFFLISMFRPILNSSDYVRRVVAFFRFGWVFVREFIWSNISLARSVLFRPVEKIHPNFITYDVAGLKSWELFILSQAISLTPGTTSVDLIDDGRTLVIHSFDADDPDAVREGIDRTLKSSLLEFTR
ncbi:MAG: Na+/H+ antiporter subunit E [Candidatus Methylacidiphilales bacterium]